MIEFLLAIVGIFLLLTGNFLFAFVFFILSHIVGKQDQRERNRNE